MFPIKKSLLNYTTIRYSLLVWIILSIHSTYAQTDSTFIKLIEKSAKLTRAGEYQMSLTVLDTALKIAETNKSDKQKAAVLNSKGRIYSDKGKVEEGLRIYLQALNLAESSKETLTKAKILKNIGALYVEQKDYKTGLDYYNKAEITAAQTTDKQLVADIFNNRGRIFDEQGKSKEGLELYQKAYKIYKELNNEERISMAANNMAIVYKNQKDYDNAAKYLLESLAISEKMGNLWVTAANYTNISNVYQGWGDIKKAIAYNKKAIEMATKINAREITIAAYHNLTDNYSAIGDYKTALEMMKKNISEKDSLFNSERTQQLAEMREKYEADKKQDTIRLLEQQKVIDKLKISSQELTIFQQNIYWAIGICSLIIIVTIAGLLYNRRKITERARLEAEILRQENHLQTAVYEAEKAERNRIARDMHDELGSGLSKIAILTNNVMQRTVNIDGVNTDMENISKTSRSLVSNMSDLVWALNADDTNLDFLIARVREYVYDFLEECNIDFKATFPEEVPDIQITKELQRNLFLSFKEILNNTVKHAKASKIIIDFALTGKGIEVKISDNGIGFDPEKGRKNGNGLRNLKKRMEQINGDFTFITTANEGTTSQLIVPLRNTTKV